jgi:hypothetical protein
MSDNKKEIVENRLNEVNRLIAELEGAKFISDYQLGDTINIKFRDVAMSLKKIGYNIYEVISKGDSIKVKESDLLRIKDEDAVLQPGEKIEFEIFRKSMDYKTDPIVSVD